MSDESIFLLVVGTCVAAWGGYNVWRGGKSRAWPAVGGEITASEVVESNSSSEDGSTTYRARVGYRYSVQGKSLEGERISFGGAASTEAAAQEVAGRYQVGKRVKVHVCPTDPSEAVLEAEVTWGSIIAAVGGGLAVLIGLYLARH